MDEPLTIQEQLDMRETINSMEPELRDEFYKLIGAALEMSQKMGREERRVSSLLVKEAIREGHGTY